MNTKPREERKALRLLAIESVLLVALFIILPAAHSRAASDTSVMYGPNLIPNPSLEATSTPGLPAGWLKGGYGTNTRTYAYPVAGDANATNGVSVSISNYASGDAKWYFTNVPVTADDTYQFSDYSMSDVPSTIDIAFKTGGGTFIYTDVVTIAAHSSYTFNNVEFIVPANVVSLTVFHLINQNGSLTTSDFSLNQVFSNQQSLIPNGNFEIAASSGSPAYWTGAHWGSNTAQFTYPAVGVDGDKAVKVTITAYSSGDAKWAFNPISVPNGIYHFTDTYASNVPSTIDVQFHNADGSYTYTDVAALPPSSSFATSSVEFSVPSGTKDITVFHLIQQVGTLTLDNATLVQNTYTSGPFSTGAVTLTFDNGWLSQYQNAIPKLDSAGIKGTFYIITHELADYGYTGFMSIAQIQNMYADGQEIGSHTQTHPDLPQLSPAEQQQEISGSRQDLLAMHVGPVNSFAYPFGDYNSTTVELVQQAGYTNARSTIDGYTLPMSDIYLLPRFVMIASTTPAQVEQWIDGAVANKQWLIIELHQIDTSGNIYSTTPTVFNQIVDYLVQKKVPVITMDQGVRYLEK
ncbi:MAG: polysaccharide deacetylase family protein [Minisyncoccota bacterium]